MIINLILLAKHIQVYTARAQPPGGRCSDWVPTSPLPDQGARVQKPSLSRDQMTRDHMARDQMTRDQMTSQLTNQMGQMNLENQGRGQHTSQAISNPRMVCMSIIHPISLKEFFQFFFLQF